MLLALLLKDERAQKTKAATPIDNSLAVLGTLAHMVKLQKDGAMCACIPFCCVRRLDRCSRRRNRLAHAICRRRDRCEHIVHMRKMWFTAAYQLPSLRRLYICLKTYIEKLYASRCIDFEPDSACKVRVLSSAFLSCTEVSERVPESLTYEQIIITDIHYKL